MGLQNHPALVSGQPFWGDGAISEDSEEEEAAPRPSSSSPDSPPSPPTPELLATVTAVSIALNLPVTPAISLPGNETAFTRFASLTTLPSFGEMGNPSPVPEASTSSPVLTGGQKSDEKSGDSEGAETDGYEDETSPTAWLKDHNKLGFSEALFPPKFTDPLTPSPLASLQVTKSPTSKEVNRPLISPNKSPAFGGSATSSGAAAAEFAFPSAPSTGLPLGSFAGVAAFRSPSFGSIAAQASAGVFNTGAGAPVSFSDIAKAAESQQPPVLQPAVPSPVSDATESSSSRKERKDRQSRHHHHKKRRKERKHSTTLVLHKATELRDADPLQEELIEKLSGFFEHPPLPLASVLRCEVDEPTSVATVSLFGPPETCRVPSPAVEIIDLPAGCSSSGGGGSRGASPLDDIGDEENQTPPPRPEPRVPVLKLKIPTFKIKLNTGSLGSIMKKKKDKSSKSKKVEPQERRPRKARRKAIVEVSTTEEEEEEDRSPVEPPQKTILRLSRVGGVLRTESVSEVATSNKRPAPPQSAVAPPIWAAAKRGRRGRGGGGALGAFRSRGGAAAAAAVSAARANIAATTASTPSSSVTPAATTSTGASGFAKKFFSSSKEDRRSSAAKAVSIYMHIPMPCFHTLS